MGAFDVMQSEREDKVGTVESGMSSAASISSISDIPRTRFLVLFAVAIFLSAFLLFLVQPLMGKYILPWFGGSPGVWTTCLLFFQLLLLAGYAYAFFTSTFLSGRNQAIVHLILLVAACALLPIIPAEHWRPAGGANPTWRILLLLGVTLGLPYFVLSSTGPLLQSWYSRLNGGAAPYRLYALSNVGSLLALLSYPVLFEPLLRRQVQAWIWSVGLVAFALVCAGCAWAVGRSGLRVQGSEEDFSPSPEFRNSDAETRIPLRGVLWLLLPACATMLLLAGTNKVCQDIAVIPFLWIVPLSLYLLSFILCFDHPRWYNRAIFVPLWVVAFTAATYMLFKQQADSSILLQVLLYSIVLFVGCMICHGELARLKPHPRDLTRYFLTISAGGALGGLFVALVAPMIFNDYFELHVALFLVGLLLTVVLSLDRRSPLYAARPFWLSIPVVAALFVSGYVLWTQTQMSLTDSRTLGRWRNFYGVLTAYEQNSSNPQDTLRLLYHGQITHGIQYTNPARRREPTSYYESGSGVGMAMKLLGDVLSDNQPRHIGLVGLGTGSLAAYSRHGDTFSFYEINPQVPHIARSQFTYLADAEADGAEVQVLLGDARVTMEAQDPQAFDLLVLDAFSGDAIPVHLLTREAVELYWKHLKPDGIIAVHVSNQHLALEPVVLRLAREFQLHSAVIDYDGGQDEADYASSWVLLARSSILEQSGEIHDAATVTRLDPKAPLWTDEYTSLVKLLRWDGEKDKWRAIWAQIKSKVGMGDE